jgi:hypothetical protein
VSAHNGQSVLSWIGLKRHTLTYQCGLRELRRFGSPAADGAAGLLRLSCVNSQHPHAEPTPHIVADVDCVAVHNLQDGRSRDNGISGGRRRGE